VPYDSCGARSQITPRNREFCRKRLMERLHGAPALKIQSIIGQQLHSRHAIKLSQTADRGKEITGSTL
jgi:hypothetical protein